MRDISRRLEHARRDRLRNTIFVFFLLVSGLIALLPLAVDSVKWHETLYCLKISSCTGSDIRRGVRYLIESEIRNNSQFGENVKVITHLPPDDAIAPFLGMAGAILLLAAAISSAALTNHQKQHTHTVLKQIKIQAIQESLEEGFTLDIHKFNLAAQNEVQKEVVRRDAGSAIASLKTTDEETLDHLKGLRAGELATLNHANEVIDLKLQLLQKEETLKKKFFNSISQDTSKKFRTRFKRLGGRISLACSKFFKATLVSWQSRFRKNLDCCCYCAFSQISF